MGRIRIGISGWEYADWQGRFYPPGLPQKERLDYLAQRFNTVEINGTFYSLKQPQHFRRYYEKTPRDFRFAVKGGRYITHMKRLRDVRTPLANHFASGVLELKEKLGPHLWQLPANFAFDAPRIDAFLELLPRDTDSAAALACEHDERLPGEPSTLIPRNRRLRHALEVRHPSFLCDEFVAMLREHRVALVFSHGERSGMRARSRAMPCTPRLARHGRSGHATSTFTSTTRTRCTRPTMPSAWRRVWE